MSPLNAKHGAEHCIEWQIPGAWPSLQWQLHDVNGKNFISNN